MPKKIPIRQCVACRERREKPQLVRVVRTPEGEIVIDRRGKMSGRGAYLCPNADCLARAIKTKALSRALECEIPAETFETLSLQLKEGDDG